MFFYATTSAYSGKGTPMMSRYGAETIQYYRVFNKERVSKFEQDKLGLVSFVSEEKIDKMIEKRDPYANVRSVVTGKGGSSALDNLRENLRKQKDDRKMEMFVGPLVKRHNHDMH